jgi:Icc protein
VFVTAHLSDNHLDGGERSEERTARVMRYLEGLASPVDAILVTGDIADHGTVEEYRRAAGLFKTEVPLFTCPGNHDKRGPYREGLLDEAPSDAPVNSVHKVGDVTFVMTDTSIPGKPDGLLDDETITWLDSVLGEGDGPAFVCFHHPPAELGLPLADAMRQFGEDRLAEVISRHPRVAALLCGHVHASAAVSCLKSRNCAAMNRSYQPVTMVTGVVSPVTCLLWSDGAQKSSPGSACPETSCRKRTCLPMAATSAPETGRCAIACRVFFVCKGFGRPANRPSWRPISADHDTMLSIARIPPG